MPTDYERRVIDGAVKIAKPALAKLTDAKLTRLRDRLVELTKVPGLPRWAVAERRGELTVFDLAVADLRRGAEAPHRCTAPGGCCRTANAEG